jgi:hypothetical protein
VRAGGVSFTIYMAVYMPQMSPPTDSELDREGSIEVPSVFRLPSGSAYAACFLPA